VAASRFLLPALVILKFSVSEMDVATLVRPWKLTACC
jgi:hypothetical protein